MQENSRMRLITIEYELHTQITPTMPVSLTSILSPTIALVLGGD